MNVGIVGLLALLVLLVLAVFGIRLIGSLFRVFFGSRDGEGVSMGHVTLICPHCQQETRAGVPTCQQCGREL